MSTLQKIYFYQPKPEAGDIPLNLTELLKAIEKSKNQGAELLIVAPFALEGVPPEDYGKYQEIRALLSSARRKLSIQPLPLLLLEAEGAWLLGKGKTPRYQSNGALFTFKSFDDAFSFSLGRDEVCDLAIFNEIKSFNRYEHQQDVFENLGIEKAKAALKVSPLGLFGERVFEGGVSLLHENKIVFQAPIFQSFLGNLSSHEDIQEEPLAFEELMIRSSCFALCEFMRQSGLSRVILGLSGGVDSALVAVLSTKALGKEAVHTYMLHTHNNPKESILDAKALAKELGVHHENIDIQSLVTHFFEALNLKDTEDKNAHLAMQNIQARVRMVVLMAKANLFGDSLLLGTSNKSELLAGYGTLYGDLAGGFNLLKDFTKSEVYRMARYFLELDGRIPERILTKAPSAELAPNQKDSDSLLPYDTLESFFNAHLFSFQDSKEVSKSLQLDEKERQETIQSIRGNEFKRAQGIPGFLSSKQSLDKTHWRYPVHWKGIKG